MCATISASRSALPAPRPIPDETKAHLSPELRDATAAAAASLVALSAGPKSCGRRVAEGAGGRHGAGEAIQAVCEMVRGLIQFFSPSPCLQQSARRRAAVSQLGRLERGGRQAVGARAHLFNELQLAGVEHACKFHD